MPWEQIENLESEIWNLLERMEAALELESKFAKKIRISYLQISTNLMIAGDVVILCHALKFLEVADVEAECILVLSSPERSTSLF